jgi:gluconolactonase
MKKTFPVAFASCIVLSFACNSNNKTKNDADNAVGKVEIYHPSALQLVDSNAAIEVIARGYTWSEGPVWLADKKMLIFSDVPENKIYSWKEGDTAKLFLTPSGYTDTIPRTGEKGSNGLTLDRSGRLLLCQHGNRQVARLNASFDDPKPIFETVSSNYKGKKFNSPNDLVTDKKNNIYFTDPIYGLPKGADDPTREIKFEGVYKISTDGKTTLLIDSIERPNGIAFSPDEKILYVASSSDVHPKWYAYNLDENGNIKSGGVLLDGFKIDDHGNIFSAGPDGVNIISPAGKLLALIRVYDRRISNCVFNETKNILFVTADDLVLKVQLHK